MRNIFLFIRRFLNFFFFLVLQIIALSMLFRYNKFHEAAFAGVAKELTGGIYDKANNVEYYFHLKATNDSLAQENLRLRNMLASNFEGPDTLTRMVTDTVPYDTLGNYRKYIARDARVSNNSTANQNNYITIHRGSNQGVKELMGVISPSGVVGTVVNVSENYSTVMSLLHRYSKLRASLKKTGETGTVQWDGNSPFYLTLIDIPTSAPVGKGDSVVTNYSDRFPKGILIGTIDEVIKDPSTNFYTLRLKPATNFFNLQYVYVIENLQQNEQTQLEEATKKKIQ